MPKRKKAKVEGPAQARSSGGRPRKQPADGLLPAQPAQSAMEDLETQNVDVQQSDVPAARKPRRAGVGPRGAYKHALRRLARAFPDMDVHPEKDGRPQQRPCPCCGSGVLPRWPWALPQGFCECVLAEDEWDAWREEWEAAAGR